jgi:aminoglycoside phosphotransferase (APT) family kinase protein
MGDTRPVRDTEALDWPRIESWLRPRLVERSLISPDAQEPMQVDLFPGGHSNLTYLLRFGSRELVLRRPPLGPVAPTAHDMAREFRWLSALHTVFPLAPQPYALCEEPTIAGGVFYVMERRRGMVIRREEPASIRDRPDERRRLSLAVVDALAALHALDVGTAGLGHLGKPAGFVDRQVRGWSERWQRAQTSALPEMDTVAQWLADHRPPDPSRPAVVHGDFKLDNLVWSEETAGQLVAVLDWEMCALGDPLVDVGILLAYWVPMAERGQPDALTTVTGLPGWSTRDELVDRYARQSGRDVRGLNYFEVFARFKIAVVIQQIYHRYVDGQTDDARFAHFGDRVTALARHAASML